jgi:uncharacterized protein (TIGR00255 family)
MTGFGRAEGVHEGLRWAWEARSVNSRGLDLRMRLPHGLDALEPAARKVVQSRFTRGSVNLTLQTRSEETASQVRVNHELVRAYLAAMEPYGLDGVADRPRVDSLFLLPGVLAGAAREPDAEARAALEAALLAGLDMALRELHASRTEEGAANAAALFSILDQIGSLTTAAAEVGSLQPERIRARLEESLRDLLGDARVDEGRFAQEAAILAGKADVREELDRLAAHVDAARGLLAEGSPAGRKLDFLAQEFNREANTLCSKSVDLELTRIGLELKAAIEQLREQIQNVE